MGTGLSSVLTNPWVAGIAVAALSGTVGVGWRHRKRIDGFLRRLAGRYKRAWSALRHDLPVHNVQTPPVPQPDAFMWWVHSRDGLPQSGGIIASAPVAGTRMDYNTTTGFFRIYDSDGEPVQNGGGDGVLALRDGQVVAVLLRCPDGLMPVWPQDDFDFIRRKP